MESPSAKMRSCLTCRENFNELITSYSLNANNLESSTDSEVIAEIYNKLLNEYNNPIEAIIDLNKKIEGTFSFAFLVKGSKSIYATRRGSPLVLGLSLIHISAPTRPERI